MRLTTEVWAKFESKGKPEATHIESGQVGLVAKGLLMWLAEHAMGHYIRVTIARSEAELERYSRHGGKSKTEVAESLLGDFERSLQELMPDGFPETEFGVGEEPFQPVIDLCARCQHPFTGPDACDCED